MNCLHLLRLAALTSATFLNDGRNPAARRVTYRVARRRDDHRAAARIRAIERRTLAR